MTDHELLAKAKRDYPVGTKFKGVKSTNTDIRTVWDSDRFSIPTPGVIYAEPGNGVLYYQGEWAKIVNKVSNLKLYKIL